MSWSHSSRVALALLVLLAAVAVPAAATVVDESSPVETAQIDESVDTTYTLTQLYDNTSSDWTLNVTTGLSDATWTVALYDNQGNKIGQNRTVTGANLSQPVEGNTSEVLVRLQGEVPQISNFTYSPEQTVVLAEFVRVQGNARTAITTDLTRPYNQDSREARWAIQNASSAIEAAREAGADVTSIEDKLDTAIDAYNGENWDNAVNLANEARNDAEQARQQAQQDGGSNTLLLVGVGVVVLLVLLGGGYWYLNRGESHDELG